MSRKRMKIRTGAKNRDDALKEAREYAQEHDKVAVKIRAWRATRSGYYVAEFSMRRRQK